MSVLKTLLASVVVGWFASLVGDTASTVILVATALASAVYLIKLSRQAVKFLRHWISAVQVIHGLNAWMEGINGQMASWKTEVNARLEGLDGRLDVLEHHAEEIKEPAEAIARELEIPHRHTP